MSLKPLVSVVVCVYKEDGLEETIKSILSQTLPKDYYEIIVVVDENLNAIRKISRYPVDIIFRAKRGGISSARNLGVEHAKGVFIAFTDADCVVSPNWLQDLLKSYEDPTVGGVGGLVLSYYRDPISVSLERLGIIGASNVARAVSVDHIPGANSSYRKSVLKEVGGWDEAIVYGGDDTDINARLLQKSYKILLSPGAIVWHKHRRTLWSLFKWSFENAKRGIYAVRKHRMYLDISFYRHLVPVLLTLIAFSSIVAAAILYGLWIAIFLALCLCGMILGFEYILVPQQRIKVYLALPVVATVISFGLITGRVLGLIRRETPMRHNTKLHVHFSPSTEFPNT